MIYDPWKRPDGTFLNHQSQIINHQFRQRWKIVFEKKTQPVFPTKWESGREKSGPLPLLFLRGLEGGLGGLRLDSALLEFVHAAGGIHKFLLARVEGMANVADTHNDHGPGGPRLDHVAARATDFRVHILRMNVCFHKRAHKVAAMPRMTSAKFRRLVRSVPNLSFPNLNFSPTLDRASPD
jgi:hypothetical protein